MRGYNESNRNTIAEQGPFPMQRGGGASTARRTHPGLLDPSLEVRLERAFRRIDAPSLGDRWNPAGLVHGQKRSTSTRGEVPPGIKRESLAGGIVSSVTSSLYR